MGSGKDEYEDCGCQEYSVSFSLVPQEHQDTEAKKYEMKTWVEGIRTSKNEELKTHQKETFRPFQTFVNLLSSQIQIHTHPERNKKSLRVKVSEYEVENTSSIPTLGSTGNIWASRGESIPWDTLPRYNLFIGRTACFKLDGRHSFSDIGFSVNFILCNPIPEIWSAVDHCNSSRRI